MMAKVYQRKCNVAIHSSEHLSASEIIACLLTNNLKSPNVFAKSKLSNYESKE